MFSDLLLGRQAAGNWLYDFFVQQDYALVSVATQGATPCIIHCYPTCSAISWDGHSKRISSLKHQSHCAFTDGMYKMYPGWPEMRSEYYIFRETDITHFCNYSSLPSIGPCSLLQNFYPVLRKHYKLHRETCLEFYWHELTKPVLTSSRKGVYAYICLFFCKMILNMLMILFHFGAFKDKKTFLNIKDQFGSLLWPRRLHHL